MYSIRSKYSLLLLNVYENSTVFYTSYNKIPLHFLKFLLVAFLNFIHNVKLYSLNNVFYECKPILSLKNATI